MVTERTLGRTRAGLVASESWPNRCGLREKSFDYWLWPLSCRFAASLRVGQCKRLNRDPVHLVCVAECRMRSQYIDTRKRCFELNDFFGYSLEFFGFLFCLSICVKLLVTFQGMLIGGFVWGTLSDISGCLLLQYFILTTGFHSN